MPEVIDIKEYSQNRQQETSHVGEVSMSARRQGELKDYLDEQIYLALGERSEFVRNLARWQEAYHAPRATEPKNFPFANSSNLTIPVIKEIVNTMVAQLTQTVLTPKPTWAMITQMDEWSPFVATIERFMDKFAQGELKLPKKAELWILESAKLGTGILEVGYHEIKKFHHLYGRTGLDAQKVINILNSGPILYNIPLEDWLIRFTETDEQDADWCGKRFRANKRKLLVGAESGRYRNVSQMLSTDDKNRPESGDISQDEVQFAREQLTSTSPNFRDTFELYDLHVSWYVNNSDEYPSELKVVYHPPTRTLLRTTYNQFWHMSRPYVPLKFFPVGHRFYGMGLCEMLETMQEEISTMHNQRIDNSTVVNTKPILVRKTGRPALKPGDPIYTSQIIHVDEMTDVQPLQLGEVSPSTVINENMARNMVERLSGITEAQSRGGMPVTRTTATAQLALLQEQAKRFDQTIRNAREGLTRIGELVFSLFFQFGIDEEKPIQWLGERGRVINGILNLPFSAIKSGFGFTATAPTSQQNKELQRQNAIAVFNLTIQMYTQVINFAINTGVPQQALVPVAKSLVESAEKFMFQILDRFDVTNPDDIVAGLRVLHGILPTPEDLGGMEANELAAERAEIADDLARLEAVLTEASGNEAGLNGVRSASTVV